MEKQYDAIVIGAGLGGLTCGAALAKEGWSTLILERQARPGGYCTSFRRGRFIFDIPEVTAGCGPDGDVGKIISYLGLDEDIEFIAIDPFQKFIYPEHTIRVPVDVEDYAKELRRLFPAQPGIRDYFETLEKIWLELHGLPDMPTIAKYREKTFQVLLDEHLSDAKLKAIVSTPWGYLGLPPSKVHAISFVSMLMSHHDGVYCPRGGYQKLADALANGLRRNGGSICVRSLVTKIIIEGGKAVGVELKDGTRVRARHVISNADAKLTFLNLVGEEHLEKRFAQRIRALQMSPSGFMLHLGVDTDLDGLDLEYGTVFYAPSYDIEEEFRALERNEIITDVDRMSIGLTVPSLRDPELAPPGHHCVHILMLAPYHHRDNWVTKGVERGEEYKKLKAWLSKKLIKAAEKVIPGLSKHVVLEVSATPMTFERYALSSEGAFYDAALTLDQAGEKRLKTKTPIEGLYLTGASTGGGGTGSCTISGFMTANYLLGWKSIDVLAK